MASKLFVLTALSALFVGCAGPDRAPSPVADEPAAPAPAAEALTPVAPVVAPAPAAEAPAAPAPKGRIPIRRAGNK
ncbi:MAG: hypothetical protein RL105_883 [Verrucomicrobiota bacterium]|jgi:hypothetical protein